MLGTQIDNDDFESDHNSDIDEFMDDTEQTPAENDTPSPEENEEQYHKLGDDDSTKKRRCEPKVWSFVLNFFFPKKKTTTTKTVNHSIVQKVSYSTTLKGFNGLHEKKILA